MIKSKNRITLLVLTVICFAICCAIVFLAGVAKAEERTFSWLPNSEADLGGYNIHYGPESRNYTNEKDCGLPETEDGRVFCSVDVPAGPPMYFAATAYDQSGGESDYSDEVLLDPPPDAVQDFSVTVVVKVSARTSQ
ncbi:MAG: hypothetical protein DRP56_00850 [Planctomycetota bacterium]|nr:MAG: hypothetical protein DRP56_00850 [Planctomycetota bacterium]